MKTCSAGIKPTTIDDFHIAATPSEKKNWAAARVLFAQQSMPRGVQPPSELAPGAAPDLVRGSWR